MQDCLVRLPGWGNVDIARLDAMGTKGTAECGLNGSQVGSSQASDGPANACFRQNSDFVDPDGRGHIQAGASPVLHHQIELSGARAGSNRCADKIAISAIKDDKRGSDFRSMGW